MKVTLDTIEQASRRLDGKAVVTPLLSSQELNRQVNGEIHFKPENLQNIGAFKFRGAYNRLSRFNDDQRQTGAVAFSSGNHAQGVALAARLLEMPATIVMPRDAPAVKIQGTRALGANIRFYDRWNESREEIAADIAERTGMVVVPAFDDPDIISGQGTCGLEIVQQMQAQGKTPEVIVCPVGGGGLMAGVSTAVKSLVPDVTIYGIEPTGFDDHVRSFASGRRERIAGSPESICDALLAATPGELTWEINSRLVDGFHAVSDDQVRKAMAYAYYHLKLVVEPGGAVALAAVLSGDIKVEKQRVVIILSGGNVDPGLFHRCIGE